MTQPDDRRARAVVELPAAYALAIGLRDAGFSDAVIASRLGIDEVSVSPLLVVAEAKLRALLGPSTSE